MVNPAFTPKFFLRLFAGPLQVHAWWAFDRLSQSRSGLTSAPRLLRMPDKTNSGLSPRLRRFDRIALAGKSPGGLEGLFPSHPPRDRAPAGALSSKANRLTIDPSSHRTSKQSVCLDDFHGANKALSGTFGKSTHGWV